MQIANLYATAQRYRLHAEAWIEGVACGETNSETGCRLAAYWRQRAEQVEAYAAKLENLGA